MYFDNSSNKFTGFAVDVVLISLEEAEIRADIRLLPFASLLPALNSNELDMVIMSPSPERTKWATFSRPFTRYGETLVVPNSDPAAYQAISDLGGIRVGSTANGGWANAATQAGAVLMPYKTVTDALCALRDGHVDAVLGNRPSYAHLLKSGTFPHLHMVESYKPVLVNELSVGCRKDDEPHLALIDEALAAFMRGSGYKALAKTWGFTDLQD